MAAGDPYVTDVLPGMLVTSVGCGLSLPILTVAAVAGTTGENARVGSALFSSVQQIGGAVGVAVLVTAAERHHGFPAEDFSFALIIAAGLLVLGALGIAALLQVRGKASRSGTTSWKEHQG